MVRCPRCGRAADGLHPLPPATLPEGAPEGTAGGAPEACGWCLHEITEG